jgi:AcrR family transcriptional regulator
MTTPEAPDVPKPPGDPLAGRAEPVDRLLYTAYELFCHRGIRQVGINELIDASGISKATFYRHFKSKDELVLAVLDLRDQIWSEALIAEARRRGASPDEQLLAVFDLFGAWFSRGDFESNTFINVLLEMGPEHSLGRACIDYLARIRGHIRLLAEEAGLERHDEFARAWHILMKGAVIAAAEGDVLAAGRAKEMAGWLIENHRPAAPAGGPTSSTA